MRQKHKNKMYAHIKGIFKINRKSNRKSIFFVKKSIFKGIDFLLSILESMNRKSIQSTDLPTLAYTYLVTRAH